MVQWEAVLLTTNACPYHLSANIPPDFPLRLTANLLCMIFRKLTSTSSLGMNRRRRVLCNTTTHSRPPVPLPTVGQPIISSMARCHQRAKTQVRKAMSRFSSSVRCTWNIGTDADAEDTDGTSEDMDPPMHHMSHTKIYPTDAALRSVWA